MICFSVNMKTTRSVIQTLHLCVSNDALSHRDGRNTTHVKAAVLFNVSKRRE